MEYYLLQAALLMLAAYLLGATLGCVLRRAMHPEVDTTAPVEETAAKAAAAPSAGSATTSVRKAPEPVQPRIETIAHPTPPQEAKVAESARFERALTSAPAAAAATAAVATAATAAKKTSSAPTDTDAKPRLPTASSGGGNGTSAVAASITTPADDLRKISGIDAETANHLNQLGYTRFSQIAAWRPQDMARIRSALGDNRANTGGWIEQAKILADGKQTGYLRRLADGAPESPWALPAAVAAVTAAALAASGSATAAEVPPTPPKVPQAPPVTPEVPPQDLSHIRGLDEEAAKVLSQNGVTTYRQIAGWTAADVERFDTLLGVRGRISRQNWIEQAKVLSDGRDTAFVQRRNTRPAPVSPPQGELLSPSPLPAAAAAIAGITATAVEAPAVAPISVEAPQSDDLTRISGIDGTTEKVLKGEGIHTFTQIASWNSLDVQGIDRLLGEPGRVSKQNWIEQASILANGKQTAFAKQQTADPDMVPEPGAVAASGGVAIANLEGSPETPASLAPAEPAEPAEPVAPPPLPQTTSMPPQSIEPTPEPDTEPLEPETEPLPPPDTAKQAPRPTRLADAIRQNAANMGATTKATGSGVAGMRSVRSQLLSGGGNDQPDFVDDLKKIRGVGVLIEKKLNAMGVYSYDQIANWSADDIQRVSSALDFKGRIEREGWVQQARILASGGQTEFSKRLT